MIIGLILVLIALAAAIINAPTMIVCCFLASGFGVMILDGIGVALYFKFGAFKFYYHDFLHWHRPDGSPLRNDGLTDHSICKHCGKDIMRDSQGNWFC